MRDEGWLAIVVAVVGLSPMWVHLILYSLSKRYRDWVNRDEGVMG